MKSEEKIRELTEAKKGFLNAETNIDSNYLLRCEISLLEWVLEDETIIPNGTYVRTKDFNYIGYINLFNEGLYRVVFSIPNTEIQRFYKRENFDIITITKTN